MPQPNKHLPKKPFFNTLSAYYQCISNIPRCSSLYLDIIDTKGQKFLLANVILTSHILQSSQQKIDQDGSKGGGRVRIG